MGTQINFVVIVQARMGSKRFPGKSFFKLENKPALVHLVDALLSCFHKEAIVIATSKNIENDVIRNYGLQENIKVYSGDENNVASRFVAIAKQHSPTYFVRLNGDSPLFCPQELKKALENLTEESGEKIDLLSTAQNRTFPKGMNFEIIKTKMFLKSYSSFHDPAHFEHVTRFFYENAKNYIIQEVHTEAEGAKDMNFCFDTKEDLVRIKMVMSKMIRPHYMYSLTEKCELYNLIEITND